MLPVKDFYLSNGGPRQELVYEVLNALACSVACVVAGTAPKGVEDCLRFFSDAFTAQLNATLKDALRNGDFDAADEHDSPSRGLH